MLVTGGSASLGVALPPVPGILPKLSVTSRRRKHLIEVLQEDHCASRRTFCVAKATQQQWRTLGPPTRLPGETRTRPDQPPPLAWLAGIALAVMLAFNALRALVRAWRSRRQLHTRPAGRRVSNRKPGSASTRVVDVDVGNADADADAKLEGSPGPVAIASRGAASSVSDGQAASAANPGVGTLTASGQADPAAPSTPAGTEAASASTLDPPAGQGTVSGGQVASRPLQPRGSKAVAGNLGRVVLCAALEPDRPGTAEALGRTEGAGAAGPASSPSGATAGTNASLEWHRRFWEPLIVKYAEGPHDQVTGLLVVYNRNVLHILEGDNNQLFALLRELRPADVNVHRLTEIRVPCYVLDARERLFSDWFCASGQRPPERRLRYSFSAAAVSGPGGTNSRAATGLSGGAAERETPEDATPEQQLVSRIQQLELFVKFVGPKLSSLESVEARNEALLSLGDAETSTPREAVVSALVLDPLAPSLTDFVDTFDLDYRRYVSLLALAESAAEWPGQAAMEPRLAALLEDVMYLGRFYSEHVRRELQDEMTSQREDGSARASAGDVAQRLSRGMRLHVQHWQS